MSWLLYLFIAYLAVCYLWATYLVVRLYTGKRLRVLFLGKRRAKGDVTIADAPAYTAPSAAQPASAPSRRKAAA